MPPLLEMKNITKKFPGVTALDDFSIEVNAGEVHALVGENGAGKSTLIKILYGVYRPDAGHILINGDPVRIENTAEGIKNGIGVVFQELNGCPHLDVANNIFLGRIKNKIGVIDDKWAIEETRKILLETVKLDVDPTRLVKYLTIADRQMIEIAKAVSKGARIVLFDEPTSSLTDNEIQHLFEIINDLKKRGVGIIYISHRLEELAFVADRVTILRDGKKIQTLNFKDTTKDLIIKLMVGREMTNIYPQYKRNIGNVIFEANHVKYKDKIDVDHIEVRSGEILGLSGLVGSGRTETMRAIFGAHPVDSKEIILNGKKVNFRNPGEAIAVGFIYMTEDRKHDGISLKMDVQDNITLASLKIFSRRQVMNDRKARKNAEHFVSQLNIKTPGLGQLAKNLSGGNQQKVILAKWLTREAKILVFDEPTRGIDVGTKFEIYNIMNTLSAQGLGIIMISSDLPEVLGMSDRVMVFRNGRVKANLDIAEANSETVMKYAIGSV
jgi:ribose transport system ATP-binding protein